MVIAEFLGEQCRLTIPKRFLIKLVYHVSVLIRVSVLESSNEAVPYLETRICPCSNVCYNVRSRSKRSVNSYRDETCSDRPII